MEIPIQDFTNGSITCGENALTDSIVALDIKINCTTSDQNDPFTGFSFPFDSPDKTIIFGVLWSWDNGATYAMSTEGMQTGISSGIFAYDKSSQSIMTPDVTVSIPYIGENRPNAYQIYAYVPQGPITFGITITEVTE